MHEAKGRVINMLKLMKYEFQKQMFSKVIIAIILGVLAGFFTLVTILGKKDASEAAIGLMIGVMTIAILYVALECMVVFEKDLNTKQSYMLFLVPQTSKSILGAKIIAGILQTLFTMLIFAAVIGICGTVYLLKYEGMKQIFDTIIRMIEENLEIKIDFIYIIQSAAQIIVLWVFMVMLGIFIITVLNTVLNGNKLISLLTFMSYFVLLFVVGKGEDLMYGHGLSNAVEEIMCYVYYGIIDLILFFSTSWLMEKKLSV